MTRRILLWAILVLGFWLLHTATAQETRKASRRAAARRATAADPESAVGSATPVERIKSLPGFQVELLYSVPGDRQGSWVSMTVDNRGRLITSDQEGKLYRVTPPAVGETAAAAVEPIDLDIGGAHGLLYAFGSLYVMVNGKESGLYRVRDTNDDDRYDEIELLRKINGAGEHGPHAIIPSPDGSSLYVCAGNHTDLTEVATSTVPRVWQEDQLLPRMWDARGHAAGKLAPGGWICRVDPDGREFELVSSGYRNEFDIAFDPEGELFTYDADMEWDIGSPWYRPTRVLHATSGSEFGWRSGTGKWPEYYLDSLPSVVDVGPGSPTGITFGTGTQFPAKYQRALFISDWSYGILYAVHLTPDGATYRGELEQFAAAAPLPLTDVVVNPHDGALYFTIGGRGTQSGLFRVTYIGQESTDPAPRKTDAGSKARALRRRLESLHRPDAPNAVDLAWPYLNDPDRFIRYAARIAIEHQPVATWHDRALDESQPLARLTALAALARHGDAALEPKLLEALSGVSFASLDESGQLDWLRTASLVFTRMGAPDDAGRAMVLAEIAEHFPARGVRLNRELSRVLIYLEAPGVVGKTLDLLASAPTQEEQIHYAISLRSLATGWTLDQRRTYFDWFVSATSNRGGMSFDGFLKNIREEAIATLSESDKVALAETLAAVPVPKAQPVDAINRPFVRKWTVDELLPAVEANENGRDFERGREIFGAVSCFKCHRVAGEGGINGPDLTAAGRRFNSRDLLDALIEPSKVVSDQYQTTSFVLSSGKVVVGRVINLSGQSMNVLTDMLDPSSPTAIDRAEVEQVLPSTTSMMPTGLLDTLNQDEILDLVAYLRSGGNPNYEAFK